jgi:dynein heavy chain
MQAVARKQDWPLDRMCLIVEITKKQKDEIQSAPKDGAYIHKYEQPMFLINSFSH